MTPTTAAIAIGSNLGDRHATIHSALSAISHTPGLRLVAISSLHETAPVGEVPQGPYLNAAAIVETVLSPRELLATLQSIELDHGRNRAREQRWGPRTLDLDLILYASLTMAGPGLTLPHPHAHMRLFVLDPLVEIAPEWVFPTLGRSVRELRETLRPAVS